MISTAQSPGLPPGFVRPVLALIALVELVVGAWQLTAPYQFYAYFPAGQGWVEKVGPYDQHLVTDLGEFNLALGTVVALAAVVFERRLVRVALGGYLVQAVPHLAFHAVHEGRLSPGGNLANLALLGAAVLVPASLLIHSLRWRDPAPPPQPSRAASLGEEGA